MTPTEALLAIKNILEQVDSVSRKLLFGYWGRVNLKEVGDHVGFVYVARWGPTEADNALELQQAADSGLPTIYAVTEAFKDWTGKYLTLQEGAGLLRMYLSDLQRRKLLVNPWLVSWIDEPELEHLTTAQVIERNAMVRSVLREFPETAKTGIYMNYLPDDWTQSERRPGIRDCNVVSFDHYNDIFGSGEWDRFRALCRADQQIILVSGGSSPWRQDPAPFLTAALAEPRVVAISAFLHRWPGYENKPNDGIAVNGMQPAYRALGLNLKGRQ